MYVVRRGKESVVLGVNGEHKCTIRPYPQEVNVGDKRVKFGSSLEHMRC